MSISDSSPRINYDGSSHCQNRGPHANTARCIAKLSECEFYEIKRRKDSNEYVGVCRKRYEAKQRKKRAQDTDIKRIQDISTYNRRRI